MKPIAASYEIDPEQDLAADLKRFREENKEAIDQAIKEAKEEEIGRILKQFGVDYDT